MARKALEKSHSLVLNPETFQTTLVEDTWRFGELELDLICSRSSSEYSFICSKVDEFSDNFLEFLEYD